MIPKHPQWAPYNKPEPYPAYADVKPAELNLPVQAISIGPAFLNDSQDKLNMRYWVVSQESGAVFIRGSLN